ncbi:MAG: flagellar hook-length control protein FliK [Nitrospinae bacterium]|nr:flagellar hook-length control protein FliK [Nitrospinota bacterium]
MPANNQNPAKTSGSASQSNSVDATQQGGTANSAGDKSKIRDQTAVPQTDPTSAVVQQSVTMADLLKTLNLSPDQLTKIAAAFNATPDQLGKIQVVVGINAQSNNAVSIGATKFIIKVAEVLNLNKSQTDSLFSALKISSVEVKPIAAPFAGSNEVVSPLQMTTANVALAAQVPASEVKQIVQPDAGGNNLSFNAPSGSNTTATTQQTNSVSVAGGFNAVLNAASANGGAAGAGNQSQAVSVVAAAQEHSNSAIMGQIIEKATILSLPNATETKMSLSPEKLGTVDIKLTMTDSSVNASIVVGSDAVKQVVEKNLDQLRLALNQQGIMVSQMNVSVGRQGEQSFGNGGLNGQNANGGSGSGGVNAVATPDILALKPSGAYGRTGLILVDLTA